MASRFKKPLTRPTVGRRTGLNIADLSQLAYDSTAADSSLEITQDEDELGEEPLPLKEKNCENIIEDYSSTKNSTLKNQSMNKRKLAGGGIGRRTGLKIAELSAIAYDSNATDSSLEVTREGDEDLLPSKEKGNEIITQENVSYHIHKEREVLPSEVNEDEQGHVDNSLPQRENSISRSNNEKNSPDVSTQAIHSNEYSTEELIKLKNKKDAIANDNNSSFVRLEKSFQRKETTEKLERLKDKTVGKPNSVNNTSISNVVTAKPPARSKLIPLNFDGGMAGSVSNSVRAQNSQFFGIKKRLSFKRSSAFSEMLARETAQVNEAASEEQIENDSNYEDNFVILGIDDEPEKSMKDKSSSKRKSSESICKSSSPPKLSKKELSYVKSKDGKGNHVVKKDSRKSNHLKQLEEHSTSKMSNSSTHSPIREMTKEYSPGDSDKNQSKARSTIKDSKKVKSLFSSISDGSSVNKSNTQEDDGLKEAEDKGMKSYPHIDVKQKNIVEQEQVLSSPSSSNNANSKLMLTENEPTSEVNVNYLQEISLKEGETLKAKISKKQHKITENTSKQNIKVSKTKKKQDNVRKKFSHEDEILMQNDYLEKEKSVYSPVSNEASKMSVSKEIASEKEDPSFSSDDGKRQGGKSEIYQEKRILENNHDTQKAVTKKRMKNNKMHSSLKRKNKRKSKKDLQMRTRLKEKKKSSDDDDQQPRTNSPQLSPPRLSMLHCLPAVTPQSGPSYRVGQDFSPESPHQSFRESPEGPVVSTPIRRLRKSRGEASHQPASCLKRRDGRMKTKGRSRKGKPPRVRISNFVEQIQIPTNPGEDLQKSKITEANETTLPSFSSSPVHYADTKTNVPKTDDLSFPDLSHFITRPSPSEDGLRRSQRTRVRPIYDIEKGFIAYRRSSTGNFLVVDSIQPNRVAAKMAAEEKKRRERIQQKKLREMKLPARLPSRRLSTHRPPKERVTHPVMSITDPDNPALAYKDVELVSKAGSGRWQANDSSVLNGSDSLGVCARLNHPNFHSGELQLSRLATKPVSQAVTNIVFMVIHGKFCFTVDKGSEHTVSEVETGDHFFAPEGSAYSIQNLRRDIGKIYYVSTDSSKDGYTQDHRS